jgi:ATP-binding protein involved in chromosome partitioning
MPSSKISEEMVIKALEGCCAPDFNISIVDLGYIRGVDIKGGEIRLNIILGAKNCPFQTVIAQRIHKAVCGIKGVTGVEIIVDRDAVWHPDMMTEKGKKSIEMVF